MPLSISSLAEQAPAPVRRAIEVASKATGVSFSYLVAEAAAESSFRPDIEAPTSSAAGLYQFLDSTWLDTVEKHGAQHGMASEAAKIGSGTMTNAEREEILDLRFDPEKSAAMAAEFTRDNHSHLEGAVGGDLTDTDLYLAHFLGPQGASKFISAWRAGPDAAAADLFPAAARSNARVFYEDGVPRSLDDVRRTFATKFGEGDAVPDAPAIMVARNGEALPEPAQALYKRAPGSLFPATPAQASTTTLASLGSPSLVDSFGPSAIQAQLFLADLPLPGESVWRT